MKKEGYKPYTAKRWTEIPKPVVVGHSEFTEEEKKQNNDDATEMLQKYKVIGKNEKVIDGDIV